MLIEVRIEKLNPDLLKKRKETNSRCPSLPYVLYQVVKPDVDCQLYDGNRRSERPCRSDSLIAAVRVRVLSAARSTVERRTGRFHHRLHYKRDVYS